ncbi:hypothetical protein EMPS_07252 [Entomortierella parvispora]|uniref:F-box domain-containing protein n=1 Tax=Entomortierella parvispora TaxID=205924 RepID=A0A9P3HDY0_9FUNG|nr:hypothetical protein EMPS_07252 [Entomortierella parvispora]
METLPIELLITIVDIIQHDQRALACCNRINKLWHSLTQVRLYQQPSFLRLTALELFVRTVDNPEVDIYLTHHSSSQRPDASPRLQNLTADSSSPSSALAPRIPPGAFVRSIDLSMLPHRWESVQYETIHMIAQGCPWIEQLNLSDCALLRDNAIQILAETLGPRRRLRSLVLSGCNRISDLAVLSICANVPLLENLELSGCDRITDISILELGSLIDLDTDPALLSFLEDRKEVRRLVDEVEGHPWFTRPLKSLDLSHCTRITDRGVKGLRNGAAFLASLNLDGCYGILHGDDGLNEWEDMDEEFTDIEEDDAP